MSALFSVTVKSVGATKATLAVRSIHPDSGPPAGSATFALMLIFDPIQSSRFSDFAKWTHLESAPLAQEMDLDSYLDPDWVKKNAKAFVKRAGIARGVLTVEPTHPGWISHLRPGMTWETAAYDNGPGEEAEAREPVVGVPVPSRDPAAGFRVGAPKEESIKLPEAFIPLHGATRYVAHPEITDPAEMKAAAAKMIGQPILMTRKRGIPEIGTVVEVRDEWMTVYSEFGGGWGTSGQGFDELKSIGRAWLRERLVATEPAPATEPAKKGKKKQQKKKQKKNEKKNARKRR